MNQICQTIENKLKMNPLELNKDSESVSNENTEVNNVDNQEIISQEATAPEVPVAATQETTPKHVDYNSRTMAELVVVLKDLIAQNVEDIREEVDIIKQTFYKKLKAEHEQKKAAFIEEGGEEADFQPAKDPEEETLKVLLDEYKQKKASYLAQQEKEKENNLLQKQHILDQMKALVESNDDVSSHINEFKDLQAKWKTIGQVPAPAVTELWKKYNAYQESFWDLIKINNELREYDFKKNLEAKTQLCEVAEKLDAEPNVISAFQQLQKLHEEWHNLGPVSRELREELWNRFKEASTVINKKHQTYFDTLRQQETENETAKTTLCEKIEAFDYSGYKTYKEWDEATKTILEWQEEWRSIGFAPRKINQKLYERYRKACDDFFAAKAAFYKETKTVFSQNLDKKKAMVELAESLKESTEWNETGEKLIQLQKEWKQVGPVNRKISDELWKRFIGACDYFFEQKNKNAAGQRTEETENLTKKKALIEKIVALLPTEAVAETHAQLRELMAEWNSIGHVPFKEKDKIYKEYKAAVDKVFEVLNIDASQRRLDKFKNNLKDMTTKGDNKLYREREKLVRAYEHLKSEIATYENNIGFFTSSSKKGGGLIKEMERKIEVLKEECNLIEQKINMIEDNIQD